MASTINATPTSSGLIQTADNSGVLALQTGGTTAVTIDGSQNVGIGTTPATWYSTYKAIQSLNSSFVGVSDRTFIAQNWYLNAAGSDAFLGNGYASFYRQLGGIHSWNYSSASNSSGAGATATMNEAMRIDSSGNLLVGKTSTATTALGWNLSPVAGNAKFDTGQYFVFNRDTNDILINFRRSDTSVGNINVTTTATAYVTSSDYRLKKDVAPMTGALAKVSALKPVTYKWKTDGSDGQGFIAHELQEVVPDCVTGEKDAVEIVDDVDAEGKVIGTKEVPVYQGIDTSFLVATLTAAIQELKAQVDAQALEIQTLKGASA